MANKAFSLQPLFIRKITSHWLRKLLTYIGSPFTLIAIHVSSLVSGGEDGGGGGVKNLVLVTGV